jgi:uncharacterized protein Usg
MGTRDFETCLCSKMEIPMTMIEGAAPGPKRMSRDFRRQLEGYGLTTAQILYCLPDHKLLLQTYVWQDYDLFPEFPVLKKFLAFWTQNLDGPLHSVTVAHSRLIKPAELKTIDGDFRLH